MDSRPTQPHTPKVDSNSHAEGRARPACRATRFQNTRRRGSQAHSPSSPTHRVLLFYRLLPLAAWVWQRIARESHWTGNCSCSPLIWLNGFFGSAPTRLLGFSLCGTNLQDRLSREQPRSIRRCPLWKKILKHWQEIWRLIRFGSAPITISRLPFSVTTLAKNTNYASNSVFSALASNITTASA